MKKKFLFIGIACAVLLCSIIILVISLNSDKKASFSSLSEEECLEFVIELGVPIPDLVANHNPGYIVKEFLLMLEADPDVDSSGFGNLAFFFNDLREAVKQYYESQD